MSDKVIKRYSDFLPEADDFLDGIQSNIEGEIDDEMGDLHLWHKCDADDLRTLELDLANVFEAWLVKCGIEDEFEVVEDKTNEE